MSTPDPFADPRWTRVQAAFDAVCEEVVGVPDDERRHRVRAACDDDAGLAEEVLALLAAHEAGLPLLDRSRLDLAAALLTPSVRRDGPPTHIGPYRLERPLGEGGMGVVYLAEREDVGRRVAIKLLRDAWLSPARRARFITEQRALAQLDHPGIARLFDAGTLPDGTPWFVMEHVDGQPITTWADARQATVADRIALLTQVARAVQHAHDQAIVHRDLKPSNILVTADGTAKLLDFGIAKRLVADPRTGDAAADATRTGLRFMTPAYAAPEQLRGERVGVFTDVYALGVLLVELLAGRPPFDPATLGAAELERRILEETPRRVSELARAHAPARAAALGSRRWRALDLVCATALQKDPARRYRSVDALLRDLAHVEADEPLDAQPESATSRVQRLLTRHWRVVAPGALLLLLALGGAISYAVRIDRARDVAVRESARRARLQQFLLALFDGGDDAGPADSLRVVTLIDRGVQDARLLEGDPAAQADLLLSLASVHQKLGRLARADSLLVEAARVQATHPDAGTPEARATLLLTRADLRIDQAQYAGADSALREAEALTRAAGPSSLLPARRLGTLGRRLEEQGRYDSATVVLTDALRGYPAGDPDPDLRAQLLGQLANVHFYAGRYDESDSLNRLALPIHEARRGRAHPTVAEVYVNFGAAEFERGRDARAEDWYRRALAIDSAFYGPAHFRTAANRLMLARVLVRLGRADEAETQLRAALAVQRATFGDAHPRVASVLNELGNVALMRQALDSADAYFARMADVYRAANGDAHFTVAVALSNRATVFNERRQYAQAAAIYRDVVGRFARAQGADHVNTGIARIKLGRALIRQRRWAEGARESEAGHDIVARQSEPGVSFLQAARTDLAEAYAALGQPAVAARWRQAWEANRRP